MLRTSRRTRSLLLIVATLVWIASILYLSPRYFRLKSLSRSRLHDEEKEQLIGQPFVKSLDDDVDAEHNTDRVQVLMPDYVQASVPFFILMMLLEWYFVSCDDAEAAEERRRQGLDDGPVSLPPTAKDGEGKPGTRSSAYRLSDVLSSLSSGVFLQCVKVALYKYCPVDIVPYVYVWENYSLEDYRVRLDSWQAHAMCLLLMDFGYYWFHRMSHEVQVMWAAHQVHHSASSGMQLSQALRQSGFQVLFDWVFYIPLALIYPPEMYLIYRQFISLLQFHIHMEVIESLGPFEHILMTPSHHRVHHGRNRAYIDRNYGGCLILFDRLFGTFEWERPDEPVVYGLVFPLKFNDTIRVQFFKLQGIIKRMRKTKGCVDKVKRWLYGPGWAPGKPRMGIRSEIPEIDPETSLSPNTALNGPLKVVTLINFSIGLVAGFLNSSNVNSQPWWVLWIVAAFSISTLQSVSRDLDVKPVVGFEALRLAASVVGFGLIYALRSPSGGSVRLVAATLFVQAVVLAVRALKPEWFRATKEKVPALSNAIPFRRKQI